MSKRKAVFLLGQPERIGETADQLSWVRNVYEADHDLTIVWPIKIPVANAAVMDIFCRGLPTAQVRSNEELLAVYQQLYRQDRNLLILNDGRYARFEEEFFAFNGDSRRFIPSLTTEEKEKGQQIRAKLGMPADARVVTLHVREGGYLPHMAYHSFRNINIKNYYPAIQYLLDRGYWIVRLGDKSMQKLGDFPPQVIDAPSHPHYEPFFDPYFISCSHFYIGMPSGPMSLANAFNVPKLLVNYHHEAIGPKGSKDILVHRKYFSEQLGRLLTYEEAITSPVVDFATTESFEQTDIRLLENSPSEILGATWEMDTTLEGTYPYQQEADRMQQHVKSIERKAHLLRKALASQEEHPRTPFFIGYLAKARVSMEFARANPGYLGHLWPDMQWQDGMPVIKGKPESMAHMHRETAKPPPLGPHQKQHS